MELTTGLKTDNMQRYLGNFSVQCDATAVDVECMGHAYIPVFAETADQLHPSSCGDCDYHKGYVHQFQHALKPKTGQDGCAYQKWRCQ